MKEYKRKNTTVKIGSFLLCAFLLLYIPSLLHWVYGKHIRTEMIRMGTLEELINTEGCIIRDEEILSSPFEGKCIPKVTEGEKVAANFVVATILSNSSQKLLDDLAKLDLRIIEAQNEKVKNDDIFSEDVIKIDNEISKKVKLMVGAINSNSLAKITPLKSELNGLIQKKASIIGGTSTADVFLNSLRKDKENLQEKIRSNTREVVSKVPGIISYYVDGYEELLNPNGIKSMETRDFDIIKEKKAIKAPGSHSVEVGKPFAKVIKGIDCYIIAVLDKDKAKLLEEENYVKIRINDISRVIDARVHYKSEEMDGKHLVAIRFDKGISDTTQMRLINIDIIMNHRFGLKVPLTSLMEFDEEEMKASIVLVKANYASIRNVKVLGKDEHYAVIESFDNKSENSVSLYDTFVLNPQNIQKGQLIIK